MINFNLAATIISIWIILILNKAIAGNNPCKGTANTKEDDYTDCADIADTTNKSQSGDKNVELHLGTASNEAPSTNKKKIQIPVQFYPSLGQTNLADDVDSVKAYYKTSEEIKRRENQTHNAQSNQKEMKSEIQNQSEIEEEESDEKKALRKLKGKGIAS